MALVAVAIIVVLRVRPAAVYMGVATSERRGGADPGLAKTTVTTNGHTFQTNNAHMHFTRRHGDELIGMQEKYTSPDLIPSSKGNHHYTPVSNSAALRMSNIYFLVDLLDAEESFQGYNDNHHNRLHVSSSATMQRRRSSKESHLDHEERERRRSVRNNFSRLVKYRANSN
jgi:hypothetical protein